MITAAYVRVMSAYNTEMNRRIFGSASRLTDADRRKDHRAFWRSIHGTLNHLLWADHAWMSRFDGWTMPPVSLADSGSMLDDFALLATERTATDTRIEAWASRLSDDWLPHDLTWTSGAAGRELTMPRGLLVMHLFNHQTHHRGQIHAMLTAAGETVGDTDIPIILGTLDRPDR